jgi:peptide/nickel transport system substrate-binding protein
VYAQRPGKMGQPFIKEVRFTDVTQLAPNEQAQALRRGALHVLTDVPTQDLATFTADNNLGGTVRVVTPMVDRRVHILAINHRRPALQNPDLRRGLMHAIDRERVLTDVFRGTQSDAHKALSGPFPASWATPRPAGAAAATLYNRDTAQGRLRAYMATPSAVPNLRLAFAADDPQAQRACAAVKSMIESATATEDRRLTVSLEPMAPRDLLNKVEELHDYDLAYVPFDYKDDWYPEALGSFLDPAANLAGGRNYLGYLSKEMTPSDADEKLGRLLQQVREFREPDRLAQLAHDVHRRFNEAVPFVPLWQIDRHLVVSTAVKLRLDGLAGEPSPRLLNPTTLFNSVGQWRVE